MTAALLSVALILTPSPITAPKEASWPPIATASIAAPSPPISSIESMIIYDLASDPVSFAPTEQPALIAASPPPEPPPPPLTPIEAGMIRLSELGATPWQLRTFGCLAWYESRNDPWAVSATNDHGIWQLNAYYHRWRWRGRDVYDPIVNAEVAWSIYVESGFRAWTTARLCGV